MKLKGKVHKYGANVDTDAIIPARYLNVSEPDELAQHCMEDIDAEFLTKVQPGDIIVALIDDEATVKTLANIDGRVVLKAENPAYSPIPFDRSDCQVLGKVCGVFRVSF